MRFSWQKFGLVACTILLQIPARAAEVDPLPTPRPTLARQAMANILELQRLTALYDLRAGIPSFNRGRRNWCWDMGNGLPTEGGLIAATALFASHRHDVKVFNAGPPPAERATTNHIDDSKVAATIIPQIAGQAVGGVGSAFELSCTAVHQRRLKKDNLDRGSVINRAKAIREKIDNDIAALKQGKRDCNELEAHLLETFETMSLAQLRCVLAKAQILYVGDNVEDAISLGRNLTGATGNSINVAAILNNDRVLNGAGAIANLTAASLITTRPIITILARKLAGQRSDKQFDRIFGTISSAKDLLTDLQTDLQLLAPSLEPETLSLYKSSLDILEQPICFDLRADQDPKLMMLRRFRETLYGPEKIAQASCSIVVGFRHQTNSTKDNQVSAAGNITYMSGQAFNILELSRERILDERKHKRDKVSGSLPEDLIEKRIKQLEGLRDNLRL